MLASLWTWCIYFSYECNLARCELVAYVDEFDGVHTYGLGVYIVDEHDMNATQLWYVNLVGDALCAARIFWIFSVNLMLVLVFVVSKIY